ncbi:MAG TPA: ion channel [Candidatus Elarobacter sp.]|jgi:uncharacterized protein YjbI with pentapeptide repeats
MHVVQDSGKSFIPPGESLRTGHPDLIKFAKASKEDLVERWASAEGQLILATLLANDWDRTSIEAQVGSLYDHLDLRGCPLRDADLQGRDLSNIDFFAADLSGANLTGANLAGAHFSQAHIRGTIFDWTRLSGAFFDDADYSERTSMIGVDLNAVNFNRAILLYDQARLQQRIDHLQRRHPAFGQFLRITSNYGRSLLRWTIWVSGVVIIFGLIYSAVPGAIKPQSLLDGLYFSAVTFTTVGYGDVVPMGIGRIIAVGEMFLGLVMAGLLIAILTKRLFGE